MTFVHVCSLIIILTIKNLLKSGIICAMIGIGMFFTGCNGNLSGPNSDHIPVIDHSKDSISITLKGKTMTMRQPKVFAYTGLDEVRYLSISGSGMGLLSIHWERVIR